MKKIFSFLFILIIILGVILIGAYLILKNEMRPAKIAERIEAISSHYGYDITFSDIDYSISMNGINAAIYDVNVEGREFGMLSGKINFNLDIIRFLFKEIIIRNMTVYNGVAIVKDFEKDSLKSDTVSGNQYALTSDIFLKNCMIIYDTLNIDSLNGNLTFNANREIAVTGNVKFKTNMLYLKDMGNIESSFALISGKKQNLILRNLSIGDMSAMSGNIQVKNDTVSYKVNAEIVKPDTLLSLLNIPVYVNGGLEFSAEGMLHIGDSLKNHLQNLNEVHLKANKMAVMYKDFEILIADGNSFSKRGNAIIANTGIEYKNRLFTLSAKADYRALLNGILSTDIDCQDADLSIINEFTEDFTISGDADIEGHGKVILDSIGNMKYLMQSVDVQLISDRINIDVDTFNITIRDINAKKSGNLAHINALSKYKGFDTHIEGTMNIPDSIINAQLSSEGNISSLIDDYWGRCRITGQGQYAIKNKKIKANTTFNILNASGTGLTDTFSIIGENVSLSGTDRIDTENILIKGKYIEGKINSMSFVFNDNPILTLNADIDFINIDSLFPITDSVRQQACEKPRIPDDLEIYFSAGCKEALFRNEQITSIDFEGKLFRDSLILDSFRGNAIKGKANGTVLYMPETGFIRINSWIDDMNLNDFLSRHPVSPYDMGGNIDAHSDLTLYQDSMTKTVKGNVQTEISGGYMLSPEVLRNVSEVIRYPVSDTFFFDNMYGEFDIADEMVSFDDFIMERHGHNLLYSGNVDFEKRIFVEGEYTIDMNIADTGMFETLLRNTGYKADTVGVQFELLGSYKNPAVNIKKNSIGEYLKNATQQVVDDFINNLNNLFIF